MNIALILLCIICHSCTASTQLWRIPPHHIALSPHNIKPYWAEMKKKASEFRKGGVRRLPLSPISGNWYWRPHFAPWTSLLEIGFFLSARKTAEAVEMELVVCRCMRERDYLGVMSALLNTITPYRSERDLRRIYCLLNRVWKCM